ncbi:MAG: hypothetical protein RLZZ192_1186, partial [Pseudomonadota bacterium]
ALGGHSLLAMRLVAKVREQTGLELSLRALFEHPVVERLAALLSAADKDRLPSIEPEEGAWEDDRVLSYGQVRLWTLDRIEGGSGNYNLPVSVRLKGQLDLSALSEAMRDVIMRHEPLRTIIVEDNGEPIGRVLTSIEVDGLITVEDLTGLSPVEQERRVTDSVAKNSGLAFDFSSDLMVRAHLLRLSDQEHILILVVHHAACDGTSIPLFTQDLSYAYAERLKGHAPAFKALPVSYADHASWQRRLLEGTGELERQLAHWRSSLAGIPELLTLPTDFVRRANRSRIAGQIPLSIDAKTAKSLERLAQAQGTTLFAALMAVYGALLGRLARQDDVVIGFPIEGRRTAEVDELVGFFVNTLSVRIDLAGSPNAQELIERVKNRTVDALVHQEIPFERLVEDLSVNRSLLHAPIFQAWFNWQTQEVGLLSLEGLGEEYLASAVSLSRFDVLLSLSPESDGSITGFFEYDSSLFEHRTAQSWAQQFLRLVDQVVVDNQSPLSSLCLIDESDREKVLRTFNNTTQAVSDLMLPEWFEQHVITSPNEVAVSFAGHTLTYAELDAKANQLAHYLRSKQIGPDDIVAVALDRSVDMVVALLAALKAGAAYLPLDPAYPLERLSFMLGDSQARCVITAGAILTRFKEGMGANPAVTSLLTAALLMDDGELQQTLAALPVESLTNQTRIRALTPHNLAYLIYTSGSSGKPKAAAIQHGGLTNYLSWAHDYYRSEDGTGAPVNTSISFDATITSIWLPLISGRCVHLLPTATEIDALTEILASRQDLSLVKLTPAHISILKERLSPDELTGQARVLVIGGEALRSESVQLWLDHAPETRLINEYGPTETVVGCTVYQA